MRRGWLVLIFGAVLCALILALPSVGRQAAFLVRGTAAAQPTKTSAGLVVENTFYITVGIPVDELILPVDDAMKVHPRTLAPGVSVDAKGRMHGKPTRPGTYTTLVKLCSGQTCQDQPITVIVYRNIPWTASNLTFPGKVGVALHGQITITGGPRGVLPTFTVTDFSALPEGVSIGPDGNVSGVPVRAGISETPVRVCVAGNCAGVVVRLIVI